MWSEIPFRYAPFVEERAPRRTAPHQPRLDWQLWFAALGHYQHNPWLLHLMYRVVTATPRTDAALALLDGDAYPFPDAPPRRVRASLYHYDFTRVASPWAAAIPGAAQLPEACGLGLRPRHRLPCPLVGGNLIIARAQRERAQRRGSAEAGGGAGGAHE